VVESGGAFLAASGPIAPVSRPVLFAAGKNPLVEKGGGHSSYVRAHARAALRAGFEPHLFCLGERRESIETDFGVVETVRSPAPGLFAPPDKSYRSIASAWNLPPLTAALGRFAAGQGQPRIFHGFGIWSASAVRASRRAASRGLPAACLTSAYTAIHAEYVSKVRGSWRDRNWPDLLRGVLELAIVDVTSIPIERTSLRCADRVLYNYESVRRLIDRTGSSAIPFQKITYAAEDAFRPERPQPPARAHGGPALVVAVSRHDPRKGLDTLLRALARLRADGVAFRAELLGGGALLERNRRTSSSLGLDDCVRIEGFVEDAFSRMRASDVFVLPSLNEQSGSLSLLEALQAGVAVAASNVDGIPEDVTDGDSALLVPPGDSSALAAALKRLVEDPELRARLARRGREVFEQRFSAEAFSAALGAVYEELEETALRRAAART
jgi:glycosyltransferase involved in cell wall biosynthesis